MTPDVVATAAGFLTPEGYGSSAFGRRPWLDGSGQPCARPELMDIAWSSLFAAPCPRFGRMSPLARAGLMAVELLDPGFAALTDAQRTDTGVCMVSPSGPVETDLEFLRTLSPAAFTYTLSAAVLGEVCIRHRLRGPGLCLMSGGSGGRGVVEEAAERIALGEAAFMVCLACEAVGPEARALVNYALDKHSPFCWYAYGLFLARKDAAPGPGRALPAGGGPGGVKLRDLCLDLCGG